MSLSPPDMDDIKPTSDISCEAGEEQTLPVDNHSRRFNFSDGNVAFQVCFFAAFCYSLINQRAG